MSRKQKGRLLGRDEAEDALEEVSKKLDRANVHHALCGGLAMQIYGSRRLTSDVDLVAELAPRGLLAGEKRLPIGGRGGVADNGVPVDVIVRDDDFAPLYVEALAAARRDNHGWAIYVVRPEHLAAMKLVAGRPKDEEDLRFLMTEVLKTERKREEARKIVKKNLGAYAAQEWDAMLVEAIWRKKAGR